LTSEDGLDHLSAEELHQLPQTAWREAVSAFAVLSALPNSATLLGRSSNVSPWERA
jgi:hypothetical protein